MTLNVEEIGRGVHRTSMKELSEAEADISVAYKTNLGCALIGNSEHFLDSELVGAIKGRVQLVFTSPPFPLNRKKKYDNLQGPAYKKWLKGFAAKVVPLLKEDGSIVIEMGNAWVSGKPTMSTLAMESLLAFKKAAGLHLCQEFIWHNPAKLPTPAQWVTVRRVRLKDSFTRLWWLSPTPYPKADNRRVLVPYSKAMKKLLRTGRYNSGTRPSEHTVSPTSFLSDNGGAIAPNVLQYAESVLVGSNTDTQDAYQKYCKSEGIQPHPARMPPDLARFFTLLCTEPGDLVFDPFAGSNTTGAVAEELGRRWVSVEIDPTYALAGRARFPENVER